MALSQRSLDLDIVTLRQIYARGSSNSIVTSNYALLSDGKGGTYWSTVSLGSNFVNNTGISGTAISSFSSIIGVGFTTSNLTACNAYVKTLNTDTIITNAIATNALNFTNFTYNLQTCNIFLSNGFTNSAAYSKLITSNLNYYLGSNDMNSYIFCTSPSNLNFVPPSVQAQSGYANPYTGQIQGNFFSLKNMGSNILNVYTNPATAFPVITSTTATFFYLGQPQNFWTPM
jgi:hypothetical protein